MRLDRAVREAIRSEMKLRVCHLISGDLWAGAEVMAFQLLGGLSKRSGIEAFAVVLNEGRLASELTNVGVHTRVLDEHKLSFPEIVWMAARAVNDWAPHILHSHRYKENLLAFLVECGLKEKAVLVSTQHGMPETHNRSATVLGRVKLYVNYKLLASRFDAVVAVSEDIKQVLSQKYRFPDDRLETIRNGIVIPNAGQGRKGRGFVIGSAGRLVDVKDYPLMVEVARQVCAEGGDIRFELAGEGPLLGVIKRLIKAKGLEGRFLLRGFVPDINDFYMGLDVFLNTSLHEGIPVSVLEAMANGVPPVVSGVGGLPEIITDGEDGYLVMTRSPGDFAERCLLLSKEESIRRRMARAARNKVKEKFSTGRMVQDYVDLYTRAANRRRGVG